MKYEVYVVTADDEQVYRDESAVEALITFMSAISRYPEGAIKLNNIQDDDVYTILKYDEGELSRG